MAESGCLHNEKFNNVDVDNKYKTGKYRADKVVYINSPISTQDNEDRNFDHLHEGKIFELFKITDTLDNSSTINIEITWPEKTLIKNIALMFVDQNGNNNYKIPDTDNRKLQVALNTKKDNAIPTNPSIMTYKDIVETLVDEILIANSTPFSIIKNFTGIHANTLLNEAPALNFNDDFGQPDFNIIDGDHTDSWTQPFGSSYPLYNRSGTLARDKIVIQIKLIDDNGDIALDSNQEVGSSFKIFAICEFLKMVDDF